MMPRKFQNLDLVLLFFIFASLSAIAQISTDDSLGTPAQTLTGPDFNIGQDLGKRAGNNLFHSFQDFNINAGESATFTGDADLQRVISRVTGGNISTIDGLLKSEIPNADFYFTNPAGFFFGPNAAIDIDGAFHVSTADYLKFGENETFFSQPLENEVLSTQAPTAYGFLDAEIGKITFEHSLLNLDAEKSFSVIGGDIQASGIKGLDVLGTIIIVPGGDVNLISLASVGEVQINTKESDISTFNLESFTELGNIFFEDRSRISVDGIGGGNIKVYGNNLTILSSQFQSVTRGQFQGGNIQINLTGSLDILKGGLILMGTVAGGNAGDLEFIAKDILIDGANSINPTGLFSQTDSESGGDGGDISISSASLAVINNGLIISRTDGDEIGGKGGDISINADSFGVIGGGWIDARSNSNAAGGDIVINTIDFFLNNDAKVTAITQKKGDGGNITISTGKLIFENNTQIDAATLGEGEGGNIAVRADILSAAEGSRIRASTQGDGNGGNLNVTTGSVFLKGILTQLGVNTFSKQNGGNAGELNLITSTLEVQDGATISGTTNGDGNAGTIQIDSDLITIDRHGLTEGGDFTTGIFSNTQSNGEAAGNAGNIIIDTRKLELLGGGQVSSDSRSIGNGGSIQINAESILIDGNQSNSISGIVAVSNPSINSETIVSSGNAGEIEIKCTKS